MRTERRNVLRRLQVGRPSPQGSPSIPPAAICRAGRLRGRRNRGRRRGAAESDKRARDNELP